MSAVLEVRDLSYRYPGGKGISGISFEAHAGEVLCIFGWNGAGKTTLLKVLSTQVPVQEGSFSVSGSDVSRDRESVRGKIFPVFDANAHFGHLTGRENARFFLSLYGVPAAAELDRAAADLDLDLDQAAGEYSLGMKRKLLLAEAFAAGKELLVFDEPTLGLDTSMCRIFFRRVREAAAAGRCVVIGTNRVEDAASADRILLLDRGTLRPAESVEALVAGMIRVTITLADRELVEHIASIDELPRLVTKVLGLGIPRKIEIGGPGADDSLYWTGEAEEKIRRAPPFLRKMIRSVVERYAKDHGSSRITPDLVDEAKGKFEQR
ncbi:MAG TPA: ATP-binding cassette domain-containing protein [Methanomicrobiales archaeon]|nr:ATP-binding cassette domain-containing protein [Methanomicrobiales archaeon]